MISYFENNKKEIFASLFLLASFVGYISIHPGGFSTDVVTTWGNQCLILGLVAIAQFFAVLVRGLDLSVGAIMALTNSVASYLVIGTGIEIAFGSFLVILIGIACGLLNGLLIAYGRIQPIIVTLATASIFVGIALLLRPTPGGEIDVDFADIMTLSIGGVPVSIIITLVIIVLFWIPIRHTGFGLALYVIGSSARSAFQSGFSVKKIRIMAFGLSGFFASLAGSYIGFVTTTGDASIANNYTINSIAAIVIGGVALRGGLGTLIGALIGAFILRTIGSLMFFSIVPPLAQPLIEGFILATAIAIGSIDMLKVRNRLEVFQ